MEKISFAEVLSGSKDRETASAASLVFPENYHNSLCSSSCNDCPFIRKASKRNGKPAILISEEEVLVLSEKLRFTLIGKFSMRPPRIDTIRRHLEQINFSGPWSIGSLDSRHYMIKLSLEEDYAMLFAKRVIRIEGLFFKILKWNADFNFEHEPPVAPVWIKLPGLKLHFFNKQILFSIAAIFGRPLKVDLPTFNFSRPSVARVLVEMDINAHFSEEIWLGPSSSGYWQHVIIENRPFYCNRCKIFGHSMDRCFVEHPHLKLNKELLDPLPATTSTELLNDTEISLPATSIAVFGRHVGRNSNLLETQRMEKELDITKGTEENEGRSVMEQILPVQDAARGTLTTDSAVCGLETNINDTNTIADCNDTWMEPLIRRNGELSKQLRDKSSSQNCLHSELHSSELGAQPNSCSAPSNPVTGTTAPVMSINAPVTGTSAPINRVYAIAAEADISIPISTSVTAMSIAHLDCSDPNNNAVLDVTHNDVAASAIPTDLVKHAPVFIKPPHNANVLISDQGDIDSDSYETYTGSYREEDMQLNEACREVFDEWLDEWEFQKSKKKQKGIRELKNLFKDKGSIRVALGSRRSLSGHIST